MSECMFNRRSYGLDKTGNSTQTQEKKTSAMLLYNREQRWASAASQQFFGLTSNTPKQIWLRCSHTCTLQSAHLFTGNKMMAADCYQEQSWHIPPMLCSACGVAEVLYVVDDKCSIKPTALAGKRHSQTCQCHVCVIATLKLEGVSIQVVPCLRCRSKCDRCWKATSLKTPIKSIQPMDETLWLVNWHTLWVNACLYIHCMHSLWKTNDMTPFFTWHKPYWEILDSFSAGNSQVRQTVHLCEMTDCVNGRVRVKFWGLF